MKKINRMLVIINIIYQNRNNEDNPQNNIQNRISQTNPKFFETLNNNDYNKHLETIQFNAQKDQIQKERNLTANNINKIVPQRPSLPNNPHASSDDKKLSSKNKEKCFIL